MGNPFQDQLLKAGLVNKKQANKVKREKHLNQKKNKKENEKATAISTKAREEQVAERKRTQELNRKHAEKKKQHEQQAQIKQLIENNRLEHDDRGEPYHFVKDKSIERIFVSAEMVEKLSSGQVAIIQLGDNYELVPAKVARQIASRRAEAVLVFHGGKKS